MAINNFTSDIVEIIVMA